jgi:hypothetical protein
MEDLATAYAVLLHDPQLRRGLITEHERSVRRPANSRIRRRLRVWLVNGLLGLATRAPISTRSIGTPVLPEGGS